MKNKIYLDNAATTPVDDEVLATMLPYFSEKFGNAMSIHSFGREALEGVDLARAQTADLLSCSPTEIVFTSGATESNNLAIGGVLKSFYSQKKKEFSRPHIITTSFEHHCVLETCEAFEHDGLAEVTYLPVNKDGIVRLADVKKAIKTNTILISVMYVNNEIGTVQPIQAIGNFVQLMRKKSGSIYPLFHTDATQGVNYFDCNTETIKVDLLSFSGHKIYAPKGIGVLYIRKNSPIKKVQNGGDQEYKMRAGTHNVPGIVGLGKAVSLLKSKEYKADIKRIAKLRDYLIKSVLKKIPQSYINGSLMHRSPSNANFRFDNIEGEGLILSLDMAGIAGSTGSACSSGALSPSHVLLAIGLRPEQAHSSLRLTLSKYTTKKEIDFTIKEIKKTVERLRRISGNVLDSFK